MTEPSRSDLVGNTSAANPPNPECKDALASLIVFDRLEIGPVRLEPRKLIAPYRLIMGEKETSTELIYSYSEPVFDPGEPASDNLADMIAAQIAINYGLFCRHMVFHGHYDAQDQRFITDATENTAREIYVKKFMEPNPFLIGDAASLPVIHKKHFANARLLFDTPSMQSTSPIDNTWHTDRNRYCVLSSGGKDSLLSYGLLQEIEIEVHPIYINESGRHWFTALNAYRHFKDHIPLTTRVWTNCDRIYNWMLRQMPFIRSDFSRLRSDEYPIRLWTVAVFLFGALPLIRKRQIGRLVIGDEYDTTRKCSHHGITHYDGLYDQSRFFDDVLSRYFFNKGWNVAQFSLLRPLSELLIEKILATRYPELQSNQISCHAAHPDLGRIRPCGRCEKCRRIVGMLLALDSDPTRCGYTSDQIHSSLQEIALQGVHQLSSDAQHLMFMLQEKNLIPKNTKDHSESRAEVMKLRFDPVRSPLSCIPSELRQPIYDIFLKYSTGAVKRIGKKWQEFDIPSEPEFNDPYEFEYLPVTDVS